MKLNEQVERHISSYSDGVIGLFHELRQMIFDSVPAAPEEKLWARMPSYYVGEAFVRLIPFKDHINIEAKAISSHREELSGWKITPKGMLQLYLGQEIPRESLMKVFAQSLE